MELIITHAVAIVIGFVAGSLVTRNNVKHVNDIVAEAKEIAEKVDKKVDALSAPRSRSSRKTNKS